ncbi:N-acetylmuramic acid 6-phosphate etherase [Solibacillus sp. R5-41]|uniref:N-acetylmuramic acid 6-phosphate etherase n=1 Tax=Solibacillus sp. R5-41 TaxID=2048654 RepID=UPI000C128804|nr:N-acetylmuramic acid 6-phosphate etherase [Solibacillus sp. R5-41]ATP41893.1 N-acetylmuramic acid 6-phosphate etherase [Solibacillus sp. R5-41]
MNDKQLTTEKRNSETMNLDELTVAEILNIMNRQDEHVIQAVAQVLPTLEKVIEKIVNNLLNGGRIFYVGAGSSGRLAMMDASECPPTFMTDPHLVQTIMAGGNSAFFQAVENAEDDAEAGNRDLAKKVITKWDTVIGITASGTTPYTIGAVKYAKLNDAFTVSLTSNKNSEISNYTDEAIEVEVGPEILTGSTRLKAATSHKMILNMISTITMVKLGKVYENLMVDVNASNKKLVERAKRIVMMSTNCSFEQAEQVLNTTNFAVKPAIVMLKTNADFEIVQAVLTEVEGNTKKAISKLNA